MPGEFDKEIPVIRQVWFLVHLKHSFIMRTGYSMKHLPNSCQLRFMFPILASFGPGRLTTQRKHGQLLSAGRDF